MFLTARAGACLRRLLRLPVSGSARYIVTLTGRECPAASGIGGADGGQ